jgi:ankyrin repeat domain-containing protein 50
LEKRAKASDGKICVAYVYLRYSEDSEITIRSVLEMLVKQTVELHWQCLGLAEKAYDQHLREETQPTEGELLDLLAQFNRVIPVTFYAIEALNEAPTDIQLTLVERLSSLNVKLFITSQPLPGVEEAAVGAKIVQISAQDRDLELHITQMLKKGRDVPGIVERGGPELREEIAVSVKTKCDGM